MKKHVLTLAGVAIASEIIAIIAVLAIFTHVLGIETRPNTGNAGSNTGNAGGTEECVNRGINKGDTGINTDLYNIEADINFSGDTVFIKEVIKLHSMHSTAWINRNISRSSLNSDFPLSSDTSPGSDISLESNFSPSIDISQGSLEFTDNTIYLYVPSANTAKTTVRNIHAYMEYDYSRPLIISNWELKDMILEIQISSDHVEISPGYAELSLDYADTAGPQDDYVIEILWEGPFRLYIEYEIILNKNSGTISYSDNQILLTNFLITPAIYRNDKPIFIYSSSFGDPYVYEINNYRITFSTNENYEIFAPGEKEIQQGYAHEVQQGNTYEIQQGNMHEVQQDSTREVQQSGTHESQQSGTHEEVQKQKIVFTATNLRDFPAVILKKENHASGNSSSGSIPSNEIHNEIHIERLYNTDIYFINSKAASEYVIEAFSFAVEKIGPYPFEKLFIVRTPISLKGMEFSNMIFIADRCFNSNNKDDFAKVLYHEIFHQWFYGIIGTDQVNEPFMDEGIVNYLAMALKGDELGNTYDERFTGMELKNYLSRDEYYRLAYIDATIYFSNIHQELGHDFYKLLQLIYSEKKFSIMYFDEFLQYMKDFTRKMH
jgi:hypothetical protein